MQNSYTLTLKILYIISSVWDPLQFRLSSGFRILAWVFCLAKLSSSLAELSSSDSCLNISTGIEGAGISAALPHRLVHSRRNSMYQFPILLPVHFPSTLVLFATNKRRYSASSRPHFLTSCLYPFLMLDSSFVPGQQSELAARFISSRSLLKTRYLVVLTFARNRTRPVPFSVAYTTEPSLRQTYG